MDINDLRVLVMLCALAAFVGITLWAWSSRRRDQFEAAARLPLDEDAAGATVVDKGTSR